MSWTDSFPIFDDDMMHRYHQEVHEESKRLLTSFFEIEATINPQDRASHVVATSLFWKRDASLQKELPPITRELMMKARSLGLAGRFDPWDHYVLPILDGARILAKDHLDCVFRIYLANDLSFLVEDLAGAGCEVAVMRSSSIRHNPGAMWRFLAMGERERLVTIIDADRGRDIASNVRRTQTAHLARLSGWRVPYNFGEEDLDSPHEGYRPINASQFGSTCAYPMRDLLESFVWHSLEKTLPARCNRGDGKDYPISCTTWPNYGFDEWFLLSAIYPRMAKGGLLTFRPWDKVLQNPFFSIDVEYATWASPNSELIYYHTIEAPTNPATASGASSDADARGSLIPQA